MLAANRPPTPTSKQDPVIRAIGLEIQISCIKLLCHFNHVQEALDVMRMEFIPMVEMMKLYGLLHRQKNKPRIVQHELIDKCFKDLNTRYLSAKLAVETRQEAQHMAQEASEMRSKALEEVPLRCLRLIWILRDSSPNLIS